MEYITKLKTITELPECIDKNFTAIESEFNTTKLNIVYLNISETDISGEQTDTYYSNTKSGSDRNFKNLSFTNIGNKITLYIEAFDIYGNVTESAVQTAYIVENASIPCAVFEEITSDAITIKCFNLDLVTDEKIIVCIYSEDGRMENCYIRDFKEQILLDNLSLDKHTVKLMVMNDISSFAPSCGDISVETDL